MTEEQFRDRLDCLIADSRPLALERVISILMDEVEMLQDEIEREQAHDRPADR